MGDIAESSESDTGGQVLEADLETGAFVRGAQHPVSANGATGRVAVLPDWASCGAHDGAAGRRRAVNSTMSYAGKVVLVTGANSGIGEASAMALSEAGARVYATARREGVLPEMRAKHRGIHWVLVDVRDATATRQAVEGVVRDAGRLDVLVNNAGAFRPGPLEASSPADIALQFETNVYGLTYATQAALPALRESKGSIVNISSAAGHKPGPGFSLYAASKSAVESLTRSWALELAPHGIRVNAIAPGPVDTPVFINAGLPSEMIAGMKEGLTRSLPLGRMAQPQEIAHWIALVADPASTWMTGQVLSVDGGMSL